jgi:hypothetical protein
MIAIPDLAARNGSADCDGCVECVAAASGRPVLSATYRYRDADGFLQEVRVTTTMARQLLAVERRSRRADERWERRHEPLGGDDLAILDDATRRRVRLRDDCSPLPPPRFEFNFYLGDDPRWYADGVTERLKPQRTRRRKGQRRPPCPICRGQWLPGDAYCLGCDRCGRDRMIPRPHPAELAKMRAHDQDDGLRGGK